MLAPGGCPQCGRRRGAACALGALPGSSRLWGLPPTVSGGVPEGSLTQPLPAPRALLSSAPKQTEVWGGMAPRAPCSCLGTGRSPMGGICCRACAKPAPAESLHGERQGQVPCAGRALALRDALGTVARGADMQQAVPSCAGRGIGHGWCLGAGWCPPQSSAVEETLRTSARPGGGPQQLT